MSAWINPRSRPPIVRFSAAENDAVERMRVAGMSLLAIAREASRQFGRPIAKSTVQMRLRALAEQQEAAMPDRPANDEMVQGYMDGWDLDAPEPSANRSHSYRHGFANARDDRRGEPRASAAELRRMADEAMEADDSA